MKTGDKVDYHGIIGGPVTSTGHRIKSMWPMPNNFGCDCAVITSKAGFRGGIVALAALTPTEKEGETEE